MEKNPVKVISEQIKYLPEADIKLAEKFIAKRDFEALLDLADADSYLAEKHSKLINPNPKYTNLNIEKLNELRTNVIEYLNLICPPETDNYKDYEDEIEEEGDDYTW